MEGKTKKKKAKLKKKKKAKGSSSDSEEESESRLAFELYLLRNVLSEFEVKVIQYSLKFLCIFPLHGHGDLSPGPNFNLLHGLLRGIISLQ